MRRHEPFILVAVLALLAARSAPAASDSYAPLKVLEGRWSVSLSGGQRLFLANKCAALAKAFVCEQVVDGSPAALVVYSPIPGAANAYKTLAADYSAATPGPWNRLTIEGSHWVYDSTVMEDGKTLYRRTINDFDGPNHIRFSQERSPDGKTWETILAGEETRAR
jgi:hypothetical protein